MHKQTVKFCKQKSTKKTKKYFNICTQQNTLKTIILRPNSLSQYFSLTFRPFTPYATDAVLATLTLLTANAVSDTWVCTLT